MANTLFLQTEVSNPYKLYEGMLRENPVYRDNINNLWAVYPYAGCKALLTNPFVQIPEINPDNKDGLNEYALLISRKMARISNGIQHEIAKYMVMILFDHMKVFSINNIIERLLKKENNSHEIDWVNLICKKLPIAAVLKSLEFKEDDGEYISGKIEEFTKIMLPGKSFEQVTRINEISKEIYIITEKHLASVNFYRSIIEVPGKKYGICKDEIVSLCVCNLIGLFIQCYDAGRGILSNSLLQVLTNDRMQPKWRSDEKHWQKSVIETLRFDPPVHNTRRVAVNDIHLNTVTIKKGEAILIVLAAANRDPEKFIDPHIYDINRANNTEHLTFGAGGHMCPAKHFSVGLTAGALLYFFERYDTIQLIENTIHYEPLMNVRLPKNIFISLS